MYIDCIIQSARPSLLRQNPSVSSQAEHLVTLWQIKGSTKDSDRPDWDHCLHTRGVVGIDPVQSMNS